MCSYGESDRAWLLNMLQLNSRTSERTYSNLQQARRKHFLSGTATGEGSVGSGDPFARSAENCFSPSFFSCLDWLSYIYVAPLCFTLHCQGRT